MAKLIILGGDQHRVFELTDGPTSVGRAPDNVLWLDDPGLSRRHCEFRRSGAQWLLRDLGSFNGSFVNNLLVTEHTLRSGDRIQLGSTVLYFVPDEGRPDGLAAPPPLKWRWPPKRTRAARHQPEAAQLRGAHRNHQGPQQRTRQGDGAGDDRRQGRGADQFRTRVSDPGAGRSAWTSGWRAIATGPTSRTPRH